MCGYMVLYLNSKFNNMIITALPLFAYDETLIAKTHKTIILKSILVKLQL